MSDRTGVSDPLGERRDPWPPAAPDAGVRLILPFDDVLPTPEPDDAPDSAVEPDDEIGPTPEPDDPD